MKIDGSKTDWGQHFDDTIDEKTKTLFGKDEKLRKGGRHAEETRAREEAIQFIEDLEMSGCNARQLMLKQKKAHGS